MLLNLHILLTLVIQMTKSNRSIPFGLFMLDHTTAKFSYTAQSGDSVLLNLHILLTLVIQMTKSNRSIPFGLFMLDHTTATQNEPKVQMTLKRS